MSTTVDEISPDIYRISTSVPPAVVPGGFTFNQFLVVDQEPLLFHTGMRTLFPDVRAAVARVIDPATLRWLAFSHVDAETRGRAGYRGYSLVLEKTTLAEQCRFLTRVR